MAKSIIKVTVGGCTRCGNTHADVEFKLLSKPIECDGVEFNYWVLCPVKHEPILMRLEVLLDA